MKRSADTNDGTDLLPEAVPAPTGDAASSTEKTFRKSTAEILELPKGNQMPARTAFDVFPDTYDVYARIRGRLGEGESSDGFDGLLLEIFPDLPRRFPADLSAEGFALGILDLTESLGGHATPQQTLVLLAFARSTWGRLAREAMEKSPWKLPNLRDAAPENVDILRENLHWLQLNDGCSVGCSFCTLNAEKLGNSKMDALDVLRLVSRRKDFEGPQLYFGSDPLDWEGEVGDRALHYFDLQALVMAVHGFIPFVSTALPRGKEPLYGRYQRWVHRTSTIPSNRARLEKSERIERPKGLDPDDNDLYRISYPPKGSLGAFERIKVAPATARKGRTAPGKDWPEVDEDRKTAIASGPGVVMTPKGGGEIMNHAVFPETVPGDDGGWGCPGQCYVNQAISPVRMKEPLPEGINVGGAGFDENDPRGLLRDLLARGALEKIERRKIFAPDPNGRDLGRAPASDCVFELIVSNATGARRYAYFPRLVTRGAVSVARKENKDCNVIDGAPSLSLVLGEEAVGKEVLVLWESEADYGETA